MQPNMINTLTQHTAAAAKKGFAWNPVFADIIKSSTGEKVGHIVSDGYTHTDWSFYPVKELRLLDRSDSCVKRSLQKKAIAAGQKFHRSVRDKTLESVVPKWVGKFSITNIEDFDAKNP